MIVSITDPNDRSTLAVVEQGNLSNILGEEAELVSITMTTTDAPVDMDFLERFKWSRNQFDPQLFRPLEIETTTTALGVGANMFFRRQ